MPKPDDILNDILNAYRTAIDAQRAEVQARNKADIGCGCYNPGMFRAWAAAQTTARTANLVLFELLDKAAYPEQVQDGAH